MSGLPVDLRTWARRLYPFRHVLLVAWGLAWMLPPNHLTLLQNNDWIPFEVGARTLVHYHHIPAFQAPALHVFADTPFMQFGPIPIVLLALFQPLPPHLVAAAFGIAMIVAGVASMAALEATARALAPHLDPRRMARYALALEVVLVPIWSYEVGYWHHLDDVIALLCISIAVRLIARGGRWWMVAVLLGTAAGTKPWAIIFLPLVLALPRPHRVKAVGVGLAAALLPWAPFLVAAPDTINAVGHYPTVTDPNSVLYLMGQHGNAAMWVRPLQFGAGMAAVALFARREQLAKALLAGSALRIAFDPYAYSYYAFAPLLAALLLDLTRMKRTSVPRWTLATLLLVWSVPRLSTTTVVWGYMHHGFVHNPTLTAALRLAWAAGVLVVLLWQRAVPAAAPLALRRRRVPVATG